MLLQSQITELPLNTVSFDLCGNICLALGCFTSSTSSLWILILSHYYCVFFFSDKYEHFSRNNPCLWLIWRTFESCLVVLYCNKTVLAAEQVKIHHCPEAASKKRWHLIHTHVLKWAPMIVVCFDFGSLSVELPSKNGEYKLRLLSVTESFCFPLAAEWSLSIMFSVSNQH